MLDKEIALAIDFKKAPKEIQELALKHYDNYKAYAKAQTQMLKAAADLESAQRAYEESAKAMRVTLKAWEPEVIK